MSGENQIPRIFICYAHKDNESYDPSKRWLDRLLEHLEPLNLQEQALIWSDQRLELGQEWHQEIQNTLEQVRAAILLVSPSFLASKYIRNSEVPVLLKNAKDKGVVIIPIILRSCLFKETKFKYQDPQNGQEELSLSVFQTANSPSRPLNGLEEDEQDEVFLSVARRLLKVVNSPPQPKPNTSEQTSLEGADAESSSQTLPNQQDNLSSPRLSRTLALKKEMLEKKLASLSEQYVAVNKQLEAEGDYNKRILLQRQAEHLLEEMTQIESELDQLR